jgi:AcrR family transcriptional regulator/DNA-binding MarR family transcriptional regulator
MTVERVVRLAGISQETFYKCFEDLDDCLLAAFEDALGRIAAVVALAYEREREWPAKVRAALAVLLAFVEDEPAVSTFVFVGALGAGPKVLACRMEALERLKVAFEHGIDEAGMVDGNGIDGMGRVAGSEIGESSPLSAEGAVNAVLGILHTRLLEGSPLARRPLSELAGPLTAMIVLPYVGHVAAGREVAGGRTGSFNGGGALAASSGSSGAGRPGSKVRPKPGARKRKRTRLSANQRAILAALEHGGHTVRELVVVTGMSDQTARNNLKRLLDREKVVKTERTGRIAYVLPSNGAGSSNGSGALAVTTASNGAGGPPGVAVAALHGAGVSNGHDRSGRARGMLHGLETRISERGFRVLAVIGELNARGSSPSNREVADAAGIKDQAQVSTLLKRLAALGLVENTGAARLTGKPYAWRLTAKGTELLRELEGQALGA